MHEDSPTCTLMNHISNVSRHLISSLSCFHNSNVAANTLTSSTSPIPAPEPTLVFTHHLAFYEYTKWHPLPHPPQHPLANTYPPTPPPPNLKRRPNTPPSSPNHAAMKPTKIVSNSNAQSLPSANTTTWPTSNTSPPATTTSSTTNSRSAAKWSL